MHRVIKSTNNEIVDTDFKAAIEIKKWEISGINLCEEYRLKLLDFTISYSALFE